MRVQLAAAREQIVEQSTEKQLERLTLRERELQWEMSEVNRQESTVRSKSKPSSKEQKLSAAIVDSITQERFLMTDLGGILPQKFVRADATSHFHADLAGKKKVLDKALSPFRNSDTATPGPRIRAMEQDVEEMEKTWDRTQTACEVGQKIFTLRQERRRMQTELDGLRQQREEEAVLAAGI